MDNKWERFVGILFMANFLFLIAFLVSCSSASSVAEKAILNWYRDPREQPHSFDRGFLSNQIHHEAQGQQAESVTFISEPEVFEDSYRSPNDVGTTVRGRARVKFSNGKAEEHLFRVFVSKSDGYTAILVDGDVY
jgi:hypothetical protein